MAPKSTPDDPRQHPWWSHVEPKQRSGVMGRRRQRRLLQWTRSQKGKAVLLLLCYLGFTLVLAAQGAGPMALLFGLPLVLLPALAYLLYWLTWQEFHH
jgi:hypothetical protein